MGNEWVVRERESSLVPSGFLSEGTRGFLFVPRELTFRRRGGLRLSSKPWRGSRARDFLQSVEWLASADLDEWC